MRSGDSAAGPTLSDLLHGIAQQAGRERISVRDLIDALGDRALGALLFLFAFPNVLPMPPGTSAVLGAPLVFLAAQLMVGRGPWLPRLLASRSMSQADFAALVRRIAPWLKRGERMLRPRFSWLARPPAEFALGAVCLVLALVLVLPVPLGNVLPAVAISLLALAIVERDGLWVLAGLAAALVSAGVVSGVIFAAVKVAMLLAERLLQ
ncbi:MAG: Exopolysaccharide synthesis ExoD [Proteobacteria bacterium]|jgi:hypothetical protein|nr:Exopolysaccharide synthesis ExoD [Pseudomonadota bacterium]